MYNGFDLILFTVVFLFFGVTDTVVFNDDIYIYYIK